MPEILWLILLIGYSRDITTFVRALELLWVQTRPGHKVSNDYDMQVIFYTLPHSCNATV